MQAMARAHSNIALIKYWGKRDETLMLPANSSVSMTLDAFYTTTTVSFESGLTQDAFFLNHRAATESERLKVSRFLNHARALAGTDKRAVVTSVNEVPTAAGLASSASGFAALAAAAAHALELDLDPSALSRLARLGSGSACRSVYGGFVEWQKGTRADGLDSYGTPIASESHWDIRMVVACVSASEKGVSSREGMRRTVATSPYFEPWVKAAEADVTTAKEAILARDFTRLGQLAEANALKMHATALGANPPVLYWQEATFAVMRKVQKLREAGLPAYFTIDAGPNVVVLCESKNSSNLQRALADVPGVMDVVVCSPGPGVADLEEVAL